MGEPIDTAAVRARYARAKALWSFDRLQRHESTVLLLDDVPAMLDSLDEGAWLFEQLALERERAVTADEERDALHAALRGIDPGYDTRASALASIAAIGEQIAELCIDAGERGQEVERLREALHEALDWWEAESDNPRHPERERLRALAGPRPAGKETT